MRVIKDIVFGEISYESYWRKDYRIDFLNKDRLITLVVDGDEDGKFEESQYLAFREFEENKHEAIEKIENHLFIYYQSICDENRRKFGSEADKLSPTINSPEGLEELVSLRQIIFMESFDTDSRKIGFLFDAKWDSELGAGVRMINGEVDKAGTQDIVL